MTISERLLSSLARQHIDRHQRVVQAAAEDHDRRESDALLGMSSGCRPKRLRPGSQVAGLASPTLTTLPFSRTIALLQDVGIGGEPRCFAHHAATRTLRKRASATRAASS